MAIVLMVLGFIWWWPLGLIILAVLVAKGRIGCWRPAQYAGGGSMGCWSGGMDRWENKMQRMQEKMDRVRAKMYQFGGGWGAPPSSGNQAFDDYRRETINRLQDEQREFKEFLERLRLAKDREQFDQFMADRRNRPNDPPPTANGSLTGSHLHFRSVMGRPSTRWAAHLFLGVADRPKIGDTRAGPLTTH